VQKKTAKKQLFNDQSNFSTIFRANLGVKRNVNRFLDPARK
jgi:hypothetical protein